MTTLDRMYRIVQRTLLTEKASADTLRRNAYHFRVPSTANKIEIRQAIEKLFSVKVQAVNTIQVRGKVRRRGYSVGTTQRWKKAMVTLAEGQTIDVL